MKSSDYIAEFFAERGITHCYGFQGTMIAHLFDSICRNPKLTNHVCYNEQGAAFAAVGAAKVTGKTTLAYATSGPGAANLISGIADAFYDSVPVVFITGQINTYEYLDVQGIRQHGFQQMDVVSCVRPVVKYCEKVERIEDLRKILEKAWYCANEGRKGPVLIDLPMDMQRTEMDPEACEGFIPPEKAAEDISAEAAEAILDAIKNSKKPILILGNGVDKINREPVLDFIDKVRIPVITSMLGIDVLPKEHELNFGYLGAAYGHRYANVIANKKADLIIALGCSLCKRQTGMKPEKFAEDAKIIRVDIDPIELDRKVHHDERGYLGDCNKVITKLNELAEGSMVSEKWIALCSEIREKLTAFDDSSDVREPNRFMEVISKYTGDAAVVCCDVGQHQVWGAQSYGVRKGQKLLFSGGHGAMGFALPAAIGAHYATGCPVAAICGDGAFQMNIQELQWVARERIPVRIFVMNNTSLGLIQQQQDDIFEGRYYGSVADGGYSTPDFEAIGKAYGISSYKVSGEAELSDVLKNIDISEPALIEVVLDIHSRAYPKTYFGEEMHNQRPYVPKEILDDLINRGE